MDTPDRSVTVPVDMVLPDDPFFFNPGAARVLLRIMRKAAARTAPGAGSDENPERLASRAS